MRPWAAPSAWLTQWIAACVGATRAWRAILLLLVVGVGWLALAQAPPPELDTGWDLANHVLAFAALALAGTLGWPSQPRARWALLVAWLAYGAAIEFAQQFVPGRSSEWTDLLADAIGVAFGAGLAGLALLAATRMR